LEALNPHCGDREGACGCEGSDVEERLVVVETVVRTSEHERRAVEAFTSLLWRVSTFSYVAASNDAWRVRCAPAKAEEMYSPETFGRSGTDKGRNTVGRNFEFRILNFELEDIVDASVFGEVGKSGGTVTPSKEKGDEVRLVQGQGTFH